MGTINQLVQKTIQQGYLTIDVEQQLRHLAKTTKYGYEDFDALVTLQLAAKEGQIQQESREKFLNP